MPGVIGVRLRFRFLVFEKHCTINAVFETYRFGRPISEITKVKGRRFMEKGESRAIVGDIEVTATTVMIGDKLEWVTEYAFTLCDGNSNASNDAPQLPHSVALVWHSV